MGWKAVGHPKRFAGCFYDSHIVSDQLVVFIYVGDVENDHSAVSHVSIYMADSWTNPLFHAEKMGIGTQSPVQINRPGTNILSRFNVRLTLASASHLMQMLVIHDMATGPFHRVQNRDWSAVEQVALSEIPGLHVLKKEP